MQFPAPLPAQMASAGPNGADRSTSPQDGSIDSQLRTVKRGAIACRRCRRFRSKCINDGGSPPCHACLKAGLGSECTFIKGNSREDRRDTRPRKTNRHLLRDSSAQVASTSDTGAGQPNSVLGRSSPAASSKHGQQVSAASWTSALQAPVQYGPLAQQRVTHPAIEHDQSPTPSSARQQQQQQPLSEATSQAEDLPPLEELEEILQTFFTTVFQVGFLHKSAFLSKLRQGTRQISSFLLLSILCTSAAETPYVVARLGSVEKAKAQASEYFDRAVGMAFQEIAEPTLERIQAFYLLAQKDWTDGRGSRSWVFMGIAIRLANILQLENAATYKATIDSPAEVQIAEEEARRTVWHLLTADDCLSCSKGRPASDLSTRISIPLPCDEEDFLFGTIDLNDKPGRQNSSTSLFANVCLVYALWGRAARLACSATSATLPCPWSLDCEYHDVLATAAMWTESLAPRLRNTAINLAGHRSRQLDLPFVFIHLIYHAAHIVVRRIYLTNMVWALHPGNAQNQVHELMPEHPPPGFWSACAHELFDHAYQLIDVACQYDRCGGLDKTISPLMAFGIFQAAAVLTYLVRWFWLCPVLFGDSLKTVQEALAILEKCKARFESAKSWCETLSAALRSAKGSSSSFLSATAARHLLEKDGYTVDPLQAVSPPKDSLTRTSAERTQQPQTQAQPLPCQPVTSRQTVSPSLASLASASRQSDTTSSITQSVPAPQPVPATNFAGNVDYNTDFFSFENLQNTMFTSDMPLVGMQDLLDFTGDIGTSGDYGTDRWSSTFDFR